MTTASPLSVHEQETRLLASYAPAGDDCGTTVVTSDDGVCADAAPQAARLVVVSSRIPSYLGAYPQTPVDYTEIPGEPATCIPDWGDVVCDSGDVGPYSAAYLLPRCVRLAPFRYGVDPDRDPCGDCVTA